MTPYTDEMNWYDLPELNIPPILWKKLQQEVWDSVFNYISAYGEISEISIRGIE